MIQRGRKKDTGLNLAQDTTHIYYGVKSFRSGGGGLVFRTLVLGSAQCVRRFWPQFKHGSCDTWLSELDTCCPLSRTKPLPLPGETREPKSPVQPDILASWHLYPSGAPWLSAVKDTGGQQKCQTPGRTSDRGKGGWVLSHELLLPSTAGTQQQCPRRPGSQACDLWATLEDYSDHCPGRPTLGRA